MGVVLDDPKAREALVLVNAPNRIVALLSAPEGTALFTFFPVARIAVFTWPSIFLGDDDVMAVSYFARCEFESL